MAKFAAGFLFLIPPVFVIKALLQNKVFAGIFVELAMAITCAGSFAMGGWMLFAGAADMYVDYVIPVAIEAPPIIQTVEQDALMICQTNMDTLNLQLEEKQGQMDVMLNQINACSIRLTEQSIDFNELRTRFFELQDLVE